jgi:hypothetical protein
MNKQTMNDRDHLEAVRVEAVRVELRDEELAKVSGGNIFFFGAAATNVRDSQSNVGANSNVVG